MVVVHALLLRVETLTLPSEDCRVFKGVNGLLDRSYRFASRNIFENLVLSASSSSLSRTMTSNSIPNSVASFMCDEPLFMVDKRWPSPERPPPSICASSCVLTKAALRPVGAIARSTSFDLLRGPRHLSLLGLLLLHGLAAVLHSRNACCLRWKATSPLRSTTRSRRRSIGEPLGPIALVGSNNAFLSSRANTKGGMSTSCACFSASRLPADSGLRLDSLHILHLAPLGKSAP